MTSSSIPRTNITFPIRLFLYVPGDAITDAMNALVNDVNANLQTSGFISPDQGTYNVASLPVSPEGSRAYAANGRKIGEGVGAGTGVWVYRSGGVWRVLSTDAPVLA